MADEKCLQRFLKDAPRFVPPNCTKLLPLEAKMLPKRVTDDEAKNMFPKPIELRSYCPVTYLNGDQLYDSIVPGDRDFIVLYNEKLYCLQGEEQLELFMRKPMKYSNLVLPHKLPPAKEIIPLKQLPMLGFLEQSISKAIEKALVAVGSLKPKLPFASISSSALLYIALHLKANNPNNSEFSRTMYRNRLIQFEDTCQLISYLGDNMSKRYKQPIERPFDFDVKMQRFLVEKKKNNNYKKSQKITLRSIVNKQNMVGLPNGMVNRL